MIFENTTSAYSFCTEFNVLSDDGYPPFALRWFAAPREQLGAHAAGMLKVSEWNFILNIESNSILNGPSILDTHKHTAKYSISGTQHNVETHANAHEISIQCRLNMHSGISHDNVFPAHRSI